MIKGLEALFRENFQILKKLLKAQNSPISFEKTEPFCYNKKKLKLSKLTKLLKCPYFMFSKIWQFLRVDFLQMRNYFHGD